MFIQPREPLALPSRRHLLIGAGLAAFGVPLLGACAGEGGSGPTTQKSSNVSLGSNSSDAASKAAWAKTYQAFTQQSGITVDVNTTDHDAFQEQINNYLQGKPQDVFSWFAGYRMRALADNGLVSDISDVWSDVGSNYSEGMKALSTGSDGKQYFLPFFSFPWAVFYRKSLFADKGYEIPATMDEFTALCRKMQSDDLVPMGFSAKQAWTSMGQFDILNMRINGYDYHLALLGGKESWQDPRVASVFETWRELLPYHQSGALGRTWQEAAQGVKRKDTGMVYFGMSLGSEFAGDDYDDLDFFAFPEIDSAIGSEALDAPVDGFMLSADPQQPENAKELLRFLSTGEAQMIRLENEPSEVATANDADTSGYTPLQEKAAQLISDSKHVAQFMDRDTDPAFASTVLGPALQRFIDNPEDVPGVLKEIEGQRASVFG